MAVTVRYGILTRIEKSWGGMSVGELRALLQTTWGLPMDVAAFEYPPRNPHLNGRGGAEHLSPDSIVKDNMSIEFVRVPSGWEDPLPPLPLDPDPQLMREGLERLSRHLHERDEER